ncbi:MAG: MarR family transcriptional regulator [Actinomycetes bacterium]
MTAARTAKTATITPTTPTATTVLDALAAGPASAAQVAQLAGIGRSTATKTLANLAGDGRVTRADGGRDGARRLPDRWSLPTATRAPKARANDARGKASSARSGKGELRSLVLGYLREHPGEHSPTTVAKALGGRSSGAVGNALVRLVELGDAIQACQTPRRYQATAG